MATFTEGFGEASGTTLESLGFTKLSGNTGVFATDGSGLLNCNGSTSSPNCYAIGSSGGTIQKVGGDIKFAVNAGLFAMGSGSGATFNAYYLRAQTGLAACRVYSFDNGVLGASLANIATNGTCDGLEITVDVSSGNASIVVKQNGTQIGTTVTDSSATKKVTGSVGIMSPATSTAVPALDNFTADDGVSAVVGSAHAGLLLMGAG